MPAASDTSELKSFFETVKGGDLPSIRTALANNPFFLDSTNESGQSAFLLAKYYHQEDAASYLLSLSPKLDIFNTCVAGQTSAVLAKLDSDSSLLESHSTDGWTPLHLAAFFGHPELANALLDRGANVDVRSTNQMKNTPLHAAAAGGKLPVLKVLLERGADVNARQEGGWTALHAAAQSGNREMVELLLAHKADSNARAANNQGPLDLALMSGKQEVVSLLEELGAKLQ